MPAYAMDISLVFKDYYSGMFFEPPPLRMRWGMAGKGAKYHW